MVFLIHSSCEGTAIGLITRPSGDLAASLELTWRFDPFSIGYPCPTTSESAYWPFLNRRRMLLPPAAPVVRRWRLRHAGQATGQLHRHELGRTASGAAFHS